MFGERHLWLVHSTQSGAIHRNLRAWAQAHWKNRYVKIGFTSKQQVVGKGHV